MLSKKDPVATVAVKDLSTAERFYSGTLGLEQVGKEGDEVLIYSAGNSQLFVYRSQYAGTNQATCVTWSVGGDVDEIVHTLAGKGVVFEQYDLPGMTREGDVHVGGTMRVAWFKDPDGNIHSVVSG